MKKIKIIALFMFTTFLLSEAYVALGQENLEVACTDCQAGRREKIRGCLKIWGNFDNGEAGGFLATGSKKVCARDDQNTCSDSWLSGCVSGFED